MSGFSFCGIHSSKFGISTREQDRIILPPRREGKVTIPGRSGYYGGVIENVYDECSENILEIPPRFFPHRLALKPEKTGSFFSDPANGQTIKI